MSTILLSGTAKWVKAKKPDDLYDKYSMDLYLDEPSWEEFDAAEVNLKKRESEDGDFITLRRAHSEYNFAKKEEVINGPPLVYIKDAQSGEYVKYDGLVGNGSKVTVAVEVYTSKKTGNKGHRWLRLFVNDLVVYDPQAAAPEQAALPF